MKPIFRKEQHTRKIGRMVFANTYTGTELSKTVIPDIVNYVKQSRKDGKMTDTDKFFHLEKKLLKPRTAYNIFCEENKNRVSQNEKAMYRGVAKSLSQLWKQAKTSGDADRYFTQAEFEKNSWKKMKQLGIEPTVYKPVVVEKSSAHLKAVKDLKQPRSAYNYYCADRMDELLNDDAAVMFGIGKALGSGWRKLSTRQKKVYQDMAEEGKKEFYKVHGCYKRV